MANKTLISLASEKGHFNGLVYEGEYLRQSSLNKQILPRTPSRQIQSLPNYQVGPRNLRNSCLINDLRANKVFYISRDSSTDDESSLQIHLFMQNEPNFRKSQMNVSYFYTRDYEQMDTWSGGKNEPKTNPNEPNLLNAQINITKVLTKEYEKMSNWAIFENEPNSKPIQTQFKPNSNPIQTQYKPNSNPNKANCRKGQNERNLFFNKELRTINYEQ